MRFAFIAVGLLMVACGSSDSVSGTVQGNSMTAQDAVYISQTQSAGGNSFFVTDVVIFNFGGACSRAMADIPANKDPPNAAGLSLFVAGTGTIAPGSFSVGSSGTQTVGASFSKTDANCQSLVNATATAGSITFSTINANQAVGTFNLSFGTDSLTGSFNASNCGVTLSSSSDAGTATCNG
jgi:hypothetical protein